MSLAPTKEAAAAVVAAAKHPVCSSFVAVPAAIEFPVPS